MTIAEIQKRAEKSQALKCFKLKDGTFLVESSDGKILYPVSANGTVSCTCADFIRNSKADAMFRCKHIYRAQEAIDTEVPDAADGRRKVSVNQEFIKNLNGRDYITLPGLLDMAHRKGLVKLDVEIVQLPSAENGNQAVCRAVAETKYGERFSDVGDASPRNTTSMISHHIIRMASTRAIARAFRSLTNVGITALEELGDLDEVLGAENAKQSKPKKESAKPAEQDKPKDAPAKEAKPTAVQKPKLVPAKEEGNGKDQHPVQGAVGKVSEAVVRAIANVGRRRGISALDLDEMAKKDFGVVVAELTSAQGSQFLRRIQTAA